MADDLSTSTFAPDISPKERERLKLLTRYAVLDTEPEEELDKLAALAARMCDTPIALISLVDADRQWFKSKVGLETSETPRSMSFCAHAINNPELFVVANALEDERFAANPLVTGEPGIRFYAGAPLLTPEQAVLGTLCVIDRVPRRLSDVQRWSLKFLSNEVMKRLRKGRRHTDLGLTRDGQLPPGVHEFDLGQLRALIADDSRRYSLWLRLISFLAWPALRNQFSHAYIDGAALTDDDPPQTIEVTLQPREPWGAAGFAPMRDYFAVGREKILEMYSIDLQFWTENGAAAPSGYDAFFQKEHPGKEGPVVRLDLGAPRIVEQFREAMDPFDQLRA